MTDIAIRVQNLSKCYRLYDRPRDRIKQIVVPPLKRMLGQPPGQFYREFWALKDVSFEIKKGETVGIIGRNGSGKSTLLQIISGTLSPTVGCVETYGRVAALLELGAGFSPEFTGRENVYMGCALLGLTKAETDAKFDAIAAFADIGDHLDQPVKTYSSGMYVRLAFSVNLVSEPDIMIVDEALAVGDMNFQAKCMTALTRIQQRGTTVLFVSHDIGVLKGLCSQGIYLDRGEMKAIGKAPEVAERYIRAIREGVSAEQRKHVRVASEFKTDKKDMDVRLPEKGSLALKRSDEFDKRVAEFRYGSGGVRITYVELLNMVDTPIQVVEFNQEVKIQIYVESSSEQVVSINFNIRDDKKINITGGTFALAAQENLATENGGRYLVEYIVSLPLREGMYSLYAQIASSVARGNACVFLDVIEDAVVFQMVRWELAQVGSKVHLFPAFRLERIDGATEGVHQNVSRMG